nr:Ig-like domain-containing protein [Shigella flexneri]
MIADNNDLTTLTATVADTEGNAIANTEVTFTLPEDVKANFTLSDGGKAITDAEGKAKVTLKGTKAGAHTVTASMTGGKSEQLVVNFIADTLTAQVNLNVTEDNFIANNVGMTRLQATVTDGNGNPLANEAVTFTLPADVSASFTLGQGGSAITDINGKAEVNRPGFPGECFICELRLPDHRFRWKHNKLFLLLPEGCGPAFPAIVDYYTSPPT